MGQMGPVAGWRDQSHEPMTCGSATYRAALAECRRRTGQEGHAAREHLYLYLPLPLVCLPLSLHRASEVDEGARSVAHRASATPRIVRLSSPQPHASSLSDSSCRGRGIIPGQLRSRTRSPFVRPCNSRAPPTRGLAPQMQCSSYEFQQIASPVPHRITSSP